jgi:hypothetical protein
MMNYSQKDRVTQPLYDHREFDVLPKRWNFFQHPIGVPGADGNARTREDTGMYLSGSLPMGNEFYATGIGVYFVPSIAAGWGTNRAANIADTLTVLGEGVLTFMVANRRYLEVSPLALLTPNFPMYWARDDDRLEALLEISGEMSGEGVPPVKKSAPFEVVPIYIQAQQSFGVEICFKNQRRLNSVGKLGVILYGQLIRDST